MSTTPPPIVPKIHHAEIVPGLTLYYAHHAGDIYLPSIVVNFPEQEAKPLAERAGVEFIEVVETTHLFPSKWLAAVQPALSDYVEAVRAVILEELAAAAFALGPHQ